MVKLGYGTGRHGLFWVEYGFILKGCQKKVRHLQSRRGGLAVAQLENQSHKVDPVETSHRAKEWSLVSGHR